MYRGKKELRVIDCVIRGIFKFFNMKYMGQKKYNIYIILQLIKVNQLDLVLFVGEALVGNEVVDQLIKFNQVLVDYFNMINFRFIDGIILIKFDIIDDKVYVF